VPSTVERLRHFDDVGSSRALRRRRLLHRVTLGALATVIGLAVLDVLDVFDAYGVDKGEVEAVGGDGTTLIVEYPAVTRPALASPFRVRVERAEGFDGPITIAISRPWIEMWDENGLYPSPSAETGDGEWVEWEFDPPDGPVFETFYDARLEPARQESQDGVVELRDDDGAVLAAVAFTTRVRP
jgi:hypothetical protein